MKNSLTEFTLKFQEDSFRKLQSIWEESHECIKEIFHANQEEIRVWNCGIVPEQTSKGFYYDQISCAMQEILNADKKAQLNQEWEEYMFVS